MQVVPVKLSTGDVHRRFKIKGDNGDALFNDLMKLAKTEGDFYIAWQDDEGDSIVITGGEELAEALEARKDGTLRLHTISKTSKKAEDQTEKEAPPPMNKETPRPTNNGAVHKNVICDICDAEVVGTRYRCLLCVDYDLCQNCERTGVHAHHGMIRIVSPLCTFVPWGARLRYKPSGRHNCTHPEGETVGGFSERTFNRRSMREAKEQITDRVSKSMQYLQEMGQAVTAALSNLGIDASYEVRGDEPMETSTGQKTPAAPTTPESTPERQPSEVVHEQAREQSQPSAPELPKADNKFRNLERAEDEYRSVRSDPIASEQTKRPAHPTAKESQRKNLNLHRLNAAEASYREAMKRGMESDPKPELSDSQHNPEENTTRCPDCRCFLLRGSRSNPCPACRKRTAERIASRTAPEPRYKYPKQTMGTSEVIVQEYDSSVCSDSSDSEFETLSYENMPDKDGSKKTSHVKPQLPSVTMSTSTSVPTSVATETMTSVYPTLAPDQEITADGDAPEDQGIAYRMIEMGFSAEEVFRVVRMHGNNFEKCIEEILRK